MAAHYADRISESLFAAEEARIRRERIAANELVARLDVKHDLLLETLDIALGLTEDIQAAYCRAEPTERRLFNQAFFERLEIDSEEISGRQLAEPFAQLLAHDLIAETFRRQPGRGLAVAGAPGMPEAWASVEAPKEAGESRVLALSEAGAPRRGHEGTPAFEKVGGSDVSELVAEEGLEPPTRGL